MDRAPELLALPEDEMRRMAEKVFGLIVDHFAHLRDLWLSLKAFGVDAFRQAITAGIENAEYVESLLRKDACWEIITPAQLGIITFRYRTNGLDESSLNELNSHIAQDIIYSGYAMLSPTILGGKHVLRMCTINPRTTDDDLKRTVEMLKSFGENINSKPIS